MRASARRRTIASALLLSGCAMAPAALAQTPRIGLLAWSRCEEPLFLRGLEELGYRPGETVTVECRSRYGQHVIGRPACE